MKKTRTESDWYVPSDWLAIIGLHLTPLFGIAAALLLPALAGIRHGRIGPFVFASSLGVIGIVLLFFARLPLYRQKKFLSVGPGELTGIHRKLYFVAYGFVGVAILLMVVMLQVTHMD